MKLYIETSVPNMLFHDDAPDSRRMTEEFFQWARVCSDEFYTSAVTEEEIGRAPTALREKLLSALRAIQPQLLSINAEARGLAQLYLREAILPPKFSDDALHVAVAVCHGWMHSNLEYEAPGESAAHRHQSDQLACSCRHPHSIHRRGH